MALPNNFSVYDETGTNRLYYNTEYMFPTTTTVYSFLTANVPGVRYISKTIGGTPYPDNTSMRDLYNDGAYKVYAIPFPKTIAGQIERLQYDKSRICTAIENKGVTVGNITLDNYAACIDAIPTGSDVAVVDFLLIGGGGGGGRTCTTNGGGGGAGGVIIGRNYALSKGSHNVTIGSKGTNTGNGGSSCFEGYVALGGGGGGTGCKSDCAGKNGASGGGAGGKISTVGKAQQCLYVQGHNGGAGNSQGHGGGGGGFGGAGCCCSCSGASGGDGGIGYLTSMTGHEECFAGGGGGAKNGHGMYGGGNSQGNASTCGSGGGGSCNANSYNGGGGALIIAYPSDCGYNISGANCSCVCNGVCVHCFTSSGTLTVS